MSRRVVDDPRNCPICLRTMFHRDGCPNDPEGLMLPTLSGSQVHTLAVALAVLRENIIKRDGDLRKVPEIDVLGDKVLKSDWYRDAVLRQK